MEMVRWPRFSRTQNGGIMDIEHEPARGEKVQQVFRLATISRQTIYDRKKTYKEATTTIYRLKVGEVAGWI